MLTTTNTLILLVIMFIGGWAASECSRMYKEEDNC